MNILTIPLTALGVFVLCLGYTHFGISAAKDDAQTQPTVEIRQPSVDEHELPAKDLPHGKPATAIVLVTQGVQTLELMHSRRLDLVLQNHLRDGTINIRLEAGEALQLLSFNQQWTVDAATSPRIVLPIEVMADRNGEHHLHIFIDHHSPEGTRTARALAVEFKVGNAEETKLFSKHDAATSARPTTVVLKAEEEIF